MSSRFTIMESFFSAYHSFFGIGEQLVTQQ